MKSRGWVQPVVVGVGLVIGLGFLRAVASGPVVDAVAQLKPATHDAADDLYINADIGKSYLVRAGTIYDGEPPKPPAQPVVKGSATVSAADLNGDGVAEQLVNANMQDGRQLYFVQQIFDTETLTPLFGQGTATVDGTVLVVTDVSGTFRFKADSNDLGRIFGFQPVP